jgi:NADH:ubiquinone oxidoreductase subunit 6 (subunit J)
MHSFSDLSFLQTITQFLIIICTFTLILFNQPLKCLLGLTGVYILTSLLFMHVNSTFLGVLYLTVYIGAVVVLFLFVIMIIGDSNTNDGKFSSKKNGLD